MPSTFAVDSKDSGSSSSTPPSLPQISSVLDLTTLNVDAGQPARLHNLSHANVVSNVGRSAQNAVSNQQAHSQLAMSILGQAVTGVQNLGPMEARSSVDVLTNNEMAQAIADLKAAAQSFSGSAGGGGGGGGSAISLWQLIKRLIELINHRLEGDGTLAHPFRLVDGGPVFAQATVTFGFPGKPAGTLSFNVTDTAVKDRKSVV